ncbi:MAG: MerR family transcriptional regulator, partial [Cellulomonadaceae bacterium]|nr:MerR family transcriptional regulator [Cellulomonadaceae bacterium]
NRSASSKPGAAHPTSVSASSITAVADASARVAAIVDAALTYDETQCAAVLALPVDGDPIAWWTDLLAPAWRRIAQHTVIGTPGQLPQSVLATAALAVMRDYTSAWEEAEVAAGNPPSNHPSRMGSIVLIFAPSDEIIPLAAHAIGAALVAGGVTGRIVTGPASGRRAVELVTMVRPVAVVLATMQAHPDLSIAAAIHDEFASLPILVAVRGDEAAAQVPLAATVQRIRSVPGLVHEVLAIAGAHEATG